MKWADPIPCTNCSGKTSGIGGAEPTYREREEGGGRVELHRCEACGTVVRFVRYGNPLTLLRERRGRCGGYRRRAIRCHADRRRVVASVLHDVARFRRECAIRLEQVGRGLGVWISHAARITSGTSIGRLRLNTGFTLIHGALGAYGRART